MLLRSLAWIMEMPCVVPMVSVVGKLQRVQIAIARLISQTKGIRLELLCRLPFSHYLSPAIQDSSIYEKKHLRWTCSSLFGRAHKFIYLAFLIISIGNINGSVHTKNSDKNYGRKWFDRCTAMFCNELPFEMKCAKSDF